MTDRQLALLLKLIAERLRGVAEEIEPTIVEGKRLGTYVWIGKGEPDEYSAKNLVSKNWEWRDNEGKLVAVKIVQDFANDLDIRATDLQEANKIHNLGNY